MRARLLDSNRNKNNSKNMVQTVRSITVLSGAKKIIIEKPCSLQRIFFSVRAFADQTLWCESKISFDDPNFNFIYVIDGPAKYFEARGEGIFQGDVWVFNTSNINLLYSVTEILI